MRCLSVSSVNSNLGVHSVFSSSMTVSTRYFILSKGSIAALLVLWELMQYLIVPQLKFLVRKSHSLILLLNIKFTEIVITGQYQQIQLGSTSTVTCSVSQLMNTNIKWISHDGAVVSSSGVLMLFGNHTIDGRIFRCVVNSPQLYSPGERNVTVIIKSKFQRYHRKFIY